MIRSIRSSPRLRGLAPVTLALMLGCASNAEIRVRSSDLTADALHQGGLAVLGVVEVDEIETIRPPLIAALDSVLAARRPDIRLVPFEKVRAALDDSTARLLLLGYELHGKPESNWLARAADSLHGVARYGVLGRVHTDRLQYEDREGDEAWNTPGGPQKRRTTIREAAVTVDVLDLTTRALVFTGEFRGYGESATPRDSIPPDHAPITGWVEPEDRVRDQPPPMEARYPEPPPLARSAALAFASFADSLPGGSRK